MNEPANRTIDLHGYPVWEAVEVATASIKEAWEQGRTILPSSTVLPTFDTGRSHGCLAEEASNGR